MHFAFGCRVVSLTAPPQASTSLETAQANDLLMAESEEELRKLVMRVKEESAKNGLKLSIKKN